MKTAYLKTILIPFLKIAYFNLLSRYDTSRCAWYHEWLPNEEIILVVHLMKQNKINVSVVYGTMVMEDVF